MIDQLVRIGLSNTCFAFLLAIVAMLIEARTKRPQFAYLFWLLVLAKLVTPPVLSIPVHLSAPSSESTLLGLLPDASPPVTTIGQPLSDALRHIGSIAWPWLGIAWLLGNGIVLILSLIRVLKFDRLLRKHMEAAPQGLAAIAEDVATSLKLRSSPEFCVTTANISPLVWWTGGRVRVIIPASLLMQLKPSQFRWVVHMSWLTCVAATTLFAGWNGWLASAFGGIRGVVGSAEFTRHGGDLLRCSGDLYVSARTTCLCTLHSDSDRITCPTDSPHAGDGKRNQQRRIFGKEIQHDDFQWCASCSNSRWQQSWILLCGLIVLPMGVAYAQDYDAVGKRLKAAVAADEISKEQARTMIGALKRSEADGERTKDATANKDSAAVQKKLWAEKLANEAAQAKLKGFRRTKAETNENNAQALDDDLGAIKKEIKAGIERRDLSRELQETNARVLTDAIKKKLRAGVERDDLAARRSGGGGPQAQAADDRRRKRKRFAIC